jgi:hypothetical protein
MARVQRIAAYPCTAFPDATAPRPFPFAAGDVVWIEDTQAAATSLRGDPLWLPIDQPLDTAAQTFRNQSFIVF